MARRALTGVLLVGGASRRFGSPKALIELDGELLHDRGRRVLAAACDEVLVVGKAGELPFDVLDDEAEVRAPIAGVVAGLRA
ncbi:MAG TPA: NTP transferase domain-containing protein, partial [Gaiellaceae bacterium]|nr:NTP transferase domain-containing protein [Gaiellaceae bacterium]